MKFINLGRNMWKIQSQSTEEFHYISCHQCPFLDYEDENEDWEEVHYICSCPAFNKSIPGPQNSNPFNEPCKHIQELVLVLEDVA